MLKHEELKKKMLNNPDVKAEYDTLEKEFTLSAVQACRCL